MIDYPDYLDEDLSEDDVYEDFNTLMGKEAKDGMSKLQIEEWADKILKADSNRETCRRCKEDGVDEIPYGHETGHIEAKPQFLKDGTPLLDEEGDQLYVDFPELECVQGHRWYMSEGVRRDIRGKNPILFESHLHNRRRREIYVSEGTPDPSLTMDRFGRPTTGMYHRTHPDGRKVNSPEQRKKNGASYYR